MKSAKRARQARNRLARYATQGSYKKVQSLRRLLAGRRSKTSGRRVTGRLKAMLRSRLSKFEYGLKPKPREAMPR